MQFDNINYLLNGTNRQREAHAILTCHEILEKLHPFNPILVGTIPIQIDIETSDLDIICCFTNKEAFINAITSHFNMEKGFSIVEKQTITSLAVVANFTIDNVEIEIFGQDIPTKQQFAYRHMIIEHNLLNKHGETFRQQIIALKQQGYKTEPAFAIALGLKGDPYTALLALEVPI